MNAAATQDLRAIDTVPLLQRLLQDAPAPNPQAAQMLSQLVAWRNSGGSRLDRDLDGSIDDPGAAILDRAWAPLADAVLAPVLGPLTADLARLVERDDAPSPSGGAYGSGWYSYVEKDLRRLLGRRVRRPDSRPFCGNGNRAACRASLWAALKRAADELAGSQGPDPRRWRSDADAERIAFRPGLLGPARTMRWSNRPTFQQVVSFEGHRRRPE
jgi:Penicillin amidase